MQSNIKAEGVVNMKGYRLSRYELLVAKFLNLFSNELMTKFVVARGNIIWEETKNNLITSAGKAAIAGLVGNTGSITAFTYLEVGISSTAVSIGQTALQSAITDSGLARVAATITRQTTTVTNDTLQLTYTWTATGSKTVEEIGIFNAASAGIMLGRALTGTKALANSDIFIATYKVIFS